MGPVGAAGFNLRRGVTLPLFEWGRGVERLEAAPTNYSRNAAEAGTRPARNPAPDRCGSKDDPAVVAADRGADRRWGKCWSPQQISRRLPIDFPQDKCMRFSHEAIYQALYVQGRGALRRELSACLRTGWSLRVPRARVRQRGNSFITPEVMISQRPAEATDRAVPGHWEGDMIIGLWARA